jgi:hypothetical protein
MQSTREPGSHINAIIRPLRSAPRDCVIALFAWLSRRNIRIRSKSETHRASPETAARINEYSRLLSEERS